VPGAELSAHDPAGVFVRARVFNYAVARTPWPMLGRQQTLTRRMAAGEAAVEREVPALIVQLVETITILPARSVSVNAENCPTLGKARALVEFSDYQSRTAPLRCPLEQLSSRIARARRALLQIFPAQHPRARVAAACAEYALARQFLE